MLYTEKYLNMRGSNYFVEEACIDLRIYQAFARARARVMCVHTYTFVEIYRILSSLHIVISYRSGRHSHFWLAMHMHIYVFLLYMYFFSLIFILFQSPELIKHRLLNLTSPLSRATRTYSHTKFHRWMLDYKNYVQIIHNV